MGVHTEWAHARDTVSLVEDGFVDEHDITIEDGNIGIAFAEVVVEGTPQELAEFGRRITALATTKEKP